ncbi:hypothetical protein HanXRQr2_Chr12g0531501 [Helianthus annuus]|uniref:Uncharacterized protein n=1 Tax=Helianthus annuus TaxID=4232 RepID=A0A9K3HEZ1_HELAN|nr:hypothetical protein HanXRQr2_Chr12g0531501 [Helianthus annuus]KAJ0861905.1 hypothetical protein HanPSC8_Chr12g0511991 [Helianthus annuus]
MPEDQTLPMTLVHPFCTSCSYKKKLNIRKSQVSTCLYLGVTGDYYYVGVTGDPKLGAKNVTKEIKKYKPSKTKADKNASLAS